MQSLKISFFQDLFLFFISSVEINLVRGQNLGQFFKPRSCGRMRAFNQSFFVTKRPNLKLKTWPRQLLLSLPFAVTKKAAPRHSA
jgi:hypothetical protein